MNPIPILPVDERAELIDAIARRTCELVLEALDERDHDQRPPVGLVDPKTLARLLGVSRSMVYEHAEQLGGVRLGEGRNARLRFDTETARKAWTARTASRRSNGQEAPAGAVPRRRRRTSSSPLADLLPIAGGDR